MGRAGRPLDSFLSSFLIPDGENLADWNQILESNCRNQKRKAKFELKKHENAPISG
jgi:hypothetical protein